MKRFALIYFLSLIFFNISSAQNQGINNNWLIGYSSWGAYPFGQTKFDFFSGVPVITYDSLEMDFRHTHANISDSLGNMLFYTNGYYIADATNDTMQNGSGLNPGAYANNFSEGFMLSQGTLIINKPGSSNIFYLFHNTADGYTQPIPNSLAYTLFLTTIDMSLNNGKGAVISKNVPIISDTLNVGKIAACKSADGINWWVTVHRANSNLFYKLLITPSGIFNYTQNIGVISGDDAGQAWFSPDGNKYAYFYINGGLDIFDFDRCSSTLSNPIHVNIPLESGYNVGMAFSPGSNALYVSNVFHVYQYDLTAANIPASQIIVAAYDSFLSVACGTCPAIPTLFGLAALAPDGKIYLTTGNSTIHMHTIDNPDVIGIGCNVSQHSVLLPAYYFNTLPNHPNYFLDCDTTGSCTCLTGINSFNKKEINARAAPNPTTGIFTLQFPVRSVAGELELYDVMGNLIMKDYVAPWSQFKHVDITQLPDGIYLCKLKWKDVEGTIKVVKSN